MATNMGNISLDALMGQADSGVTPDAPETPEAAGDAGGDTDTADADIFDALSKFDPKKIADYFKMKGWLDADWKLPEGAVDGGEPVAEAAGAFGDMANPDESVDPMTNITGVF